MTSEATEQDFTDMMNLLMNKEKIELNKRNWVFITGVGGYLKYIFRRYGKFKMPRKLKKRVYLTKKLRKQHIPEYYERYN